MKNFLYYLPNQQQQIITPGSVKVDTSGTSEPGGMRQDMDLERIGSRQRDKSMVYHEESEALDQIAKEVNILTKIITKLSCLTTFPMSARPTT